MKPNRHVLIRIEECSEANAEAKSVAVSLERCVVLITHFTPEGHYDSSVLLDRQPTPVEAREALRAAHLSDGFSALTHLDRADVLWRLALIAAGDARGMPSRPSSRPIRDGKRAD